MVTNILKAIITIKKRSNPAALKKIGGVEFAKKGSVRPSSWQKQRE